jgi:hypothetical protein
LVVIPAALTESASALDVLSDTMSTTLTLTETGLARDVSTVSVSPSVSISESVSASDVAAGAVVYSVSVLDSAAASDVQIPALYLTRDVIEAAQAGDTEAVSLAAFVSQLEALIAQDASMASIPSISGGVYLLMSKEKTMLKKSTAKIITFLMRLNVDHLTGATGQSVVVQISKDGSPFAPPAGSVTEVGYGWYAVALTVADTDTAGTLSFHATAPMCDPADWSEIVVKGDVDYLDQSVAGVASLVVGMAP